MVEMGDLSQQDKRERVSNFYLENTEKVIKSFEDGKTKRGRLEFTTCPKPPAHAR